MNLNALRGRLDKLERGRPDTPLVCWSNLFCPLDEIQPDASGIDWIALRTSTGRPTPCPIEEAIRRAGEIVPALPPGKPIV